MTAFEIVELGPQHAAVVRGSVPVQELPEFFGRAFTAVMAALEAQGVAPVGPPIGYYPGMPGETVDVEAGYPTARPVEADGEVVPLVLPVGRAAHTVHVGSYDGLAATYEALLAWLAETGESPMEQMWESYLSDPEVEPDPSTWRTEIYWPLHPRP